MSCTSYHDLNYIDEKECDITYDLEDYEQNNNEMFEEFDWEIVIYYSDEVFDHENYNEKSIKRDSKLELLRLNIAESFWNLTFEIQKNC